MNNILITHIIYTILSLVKHHNQYTAIALTFINKLNKQLIVIVPHMYHNCLTKKYRYYYGKAIYNNQNILRHYIV